MSQESLCRMTVCENKWEREETKTKLLSLPGGHS